MINKTKTRNIINIYNKKFYQLNKIKELYYSENKINENLLKNDSVLNVYIEPTNNCNMNCYYCARENSKREISYLSFSEFKNIVDPLPRGSYITLTGNGEPLLNKEIYKMINYASESGILASVITNGTVLNENNSKKLINSGVSRIQISFDSIKPEIYNKMKPGVDFNKTLLKVLKFIYKARKSESNIFITISTVMTEEVKKYAKESKKYWAQLPINNYYEGPLLSLQTDSKGYKEIDFDDEDWKPCIDPWVVLKVNADGSVNPCPMDFSSKYKIGNLTQNNIFEIMNSKKALDFKKALLNYNTEFFKEINYKCNKCKTWTDSIGYNLNNFIEEHLPIRLGLVVEETNLDKNNYNLEKLIKEIQRYELLN